METIGVLQSRDLIRMRDTATLQEAAKLMCDMSMGALGVNGPDYRFLGLVTERDLLWALAEGKDGLKTTLAEVVNDFPIIAEGPIGPDEALRRMTHAHVRHLLIREQGDLRIVSMRDLVSAHIDHSATHGHSFASAAELKRMLGSVDGL